MSRTFRVFFAVLLVCGGSCALLAECPVNVIIVNGRVEDAPRRSMVRVRLIYAKHKIGESGEVTVDGESFRIQIPFLTRSRGSFLNGNIPPERCDRKPEMVVVTLTDADHEFDRVSLDRATSFTMPDPSAYSMRAEIVLHGAASTVPER